MDTKQELLKNKYSMKKPWGNFQQFTLNQKSTVKILKILPKRKLSLQKHHKRNEFWKVIKGNCIILIGKDEYRAKEGDEFFIPKKTEHRIIGGDMTSEVLEISFGTFDEEDIIRLEDVYGRNKI